MPKGRGKRSGLTMSMEITTYSAVSSYSAAVVTFTSGISGGIWFRRSPLFLLQSLRVLWDIYRKIINMQARQCEFCHATLSDHHWAHFRIHPSGDDETSITSPKNHRNTATISGCRCVFKIALVSRQWFWFFPSPPLFRTSRLSNFVEMTNKEVRQMRSVPM
jgi:hypothetical protein